MLEAAEALLAASDEADSLLLFELLAEELLFELLAEELLFELLAEELLFELEPSLLQPVKETEQQIRAAAVSAISFLILIYEYLLSELLGISKPL